MNEPLPIWVVYDHPLDFPHCFVARQYLDEKPTENLIVSTDLDQVRMVLEMRGLVHLSPQPGDDPKILEIWL